MCKRFEWKLAHCEKTGTAEKSGENRRSQKRNVGNEIFTGENSVFYDSYYSYIWCESTYNIEFPGTTSSWPNTLSLIIIVYPHFFADHTNYDRCVFLRLTSYCSILYIALWEGSVIPNQIHIEPRRNIQKALFRSFDIVRAGHEFLRVWHITIFRNYSIADVYFWLGPKTHIFNDLSDMGGQRVTFIGVTLTCLL